MTENTSLSLLNITLNIYNRRKTVTYEIPMNTDVETYACMRLERSLAPPPPAPAAVGEVALPMGV